MHEIFISYSSKDKALAERVCEKLEKNNLHVWIAPRDVPAGSNFAQSIVEAINTSQVFILLWTGNANKSKHILNEINQAFDRGIDIIPFRLEEIEPSSALQYYIGRTQWLDAFQSPWEQHLDKLIKQIINLIGIENLEQLQEKEKSMKEHFENPFTFGNPIRNPERFIGRKEEIRQVTNRLLSSARESTSIVGERRIGKTSLLKYLTDPEIAASFGLKNDEFCLVYIDFQGLNDITPQRFWQRVLRLMARKMQNPERKEQFKRLSKEEYIDFFDLEDLFMEIGDDGIHVVLLMDEFEYVTQNPNFDSDFFGGLRSLAIHYNLSLVPATRRELVELCHSEEIKGSPFFNIFATVILKPFTPAETDLLITQYASSTDMQFSDEEIRFMKSFGGGYPFFMQMIGHYMTSAKKKGLKGEALFSCARSDFAQQAEPHFSYLWSHASESEKITLVTIFALQAEKEKTPARLIDIGTISKIYPRAPKDISSLIKRGSLVDVNDEMFLFSESYKEWIGLELSAAPGEEETEASVEAWVKTQKDKELAGSKTILTKTKKKYWPIVGKVFKEFSAEVIGSITVNLLKGMI